MPREYFSHVDTWVFDLDNTLYPPHMRLFDQIEVKMTDFVMQTLGVARVEADRLRSRYWAEYGTTLAGLMHHHDIDPEPYLAQVHDISFAPLAPDHDLTKRISALSGRKIVYTNGTAAYAQNVLGARGLSGLFDAVYGVEDARYQPKPHEAAFAEVFAKAGLTPQSAAMFEDDPRNLAVPHALGMRTVHVAPEALAANHIHHHTDDLSDFLAKLL